MSRGVSRRDTCLENPSLVLAHVVIILKQYLTVKNVSRTKAIYVNKCEFVALMKPCLTNATFS